MEEEELEEESYGEEEGEQVTAAIDEVVEADTGCGLIPHLVTHQELATNESSEEPITTEEQARAKFAKTVQALSQKLHEDKTPI